ncbi:MAG: undecaprenyl/decaprenyl-phosphate alpha-N-acetylglucosaminyl 1-phosphate transferase [Elusimicrobiales bacterium]|nr:undecaprenyl/decaprenyl-phosphate alpha-N-acetylglucosaminyl 1-phosphate transferase [Elusimicrobiales bacterium]
MFVKKSSILYVFALTVLIVLFPIGGFSAWTWEAAVRWFYLFVIATLISALLTPLSMVLARRIGAMDYPGDRKIHSRVVPRLGGLAVYAAFIFTIIRSYQCSPKVIGIVIGGTIIFILGVADDVKNLTARTRLFWQFLAAIIVVYFGLHMSFTLQMPFGNIFSYALSVIWLVGITNAFNFMDGIDGLALSMGVVCSLLFLGIAWNSNQHMVAFLSAAMAGGCLGLLKTNWQPAKVFLGDGGSTFIGFVLGCLALAGSWATDNPMVALSTPILILGIPIFDIIYTTISRIKNGKITNLKEWLEYASTDHFHHRLMNLGLGVKSTVGFILLLNICLGLGAWTMRHTNSTLGTMFLLFQAVLIFIIVVILMLMGREVTGKKDKKRLFP